jgi:predicted ATPase/class 3 adenylate cyclase
MSSLPSGTVTFLFTDIEGSTKLARKHPDIWEKLQDRHHAILQSAAEVHKGYVFKIVGDAFCVAFHTASAGLNAAADAQRKLQHEDWGETPIKVRMGLHTGSAELIGSDYRGYLTLAKVQRVMSVACGGQVLLSNTSAELLHHELPSGITLRDMKEHRLKGLPEPERLWQIIAPGLQLDFPPLQSLTEIPNNLPIQPTPFIGRTTQIVAVKELLQREDVHLVTLLGPGGTGKTRLSLRVAQEMLDHFTHGAFFIPLADDTDSIQFTSRVAQQLEIREGGRPLLENIKDYLRDKRMLLVLDNFEQLVSAAPVVAELLAAAPQLKIITSSRIALNLHGERGYLVPPLELPQAEHESALENLLENESILLFVGRAQAVHPNFGLKEENASDVAEICRRLDGLPLALELAAARVKLLPPRAILTRLDNKLKLLTGGARDLPTRHQTLRNTLEWSYDLLNQDEKILYARLSVFVGGFTLEAAEAVCNQDGKLDVLDSLTALVNNSLLRQDETVDGEPRFGMLETIRAYALERLAERGEMDVLRAQHAGYFGHLIASHALLELYSAKAVYWLGWLEREHDNIRATLNWYLADRDSAELLATLVFALTWFWYRRGYFSEGRLWAERALASPALKPGGPAHALALGSNGLLAIWQGEQQIGLAHLQESLAIWQRLEDKQWLAPVLLANGIALINMGRDSAALPFMEKARAIFEEANQPYFYVFTLVHLGNAELGLGNPDQARAWLEKAHAEAGTIGDSWLLSFALNNLGEVARTLGQYDRARTYYEQSESLLRSIDDKGDLARLIHTLGYIAQYEEDFELAESQFRKSLTLFRRLGNRRGIAECLAGLAGLKARQGQIEWGTIMLSAAESVLKITGGAWWPADRVEVERNREMLQSALPADEFTKAWKTGGAMNMDQAIAFASNET